MQVHAGGGEDVVAPAVIPHQEALPDSDFLYLGSTHRTAYSLLEYGLLTEAPFMVLTGDPGTGKTSLLRAIQRKT